MSSNKKALIAMLACFLVTAVLWQGIMVSRDFAVITGTLATAMLCALAIWKIAGWADEQNQRRRDNDRALREQSDTPLR